MNMTRTVAAPLLTVAAVVAVVLYFFYCAPQLRYCWGVHTTTNY